MVCVFAGGPALAQGAEPCRFVEIGTGTVRAVTDDGLVLEDGRTIRLAGIEVVEHAEPEPGTVVALKRLASVPETDRYGRMVAHVFTQENGAERWLQGDMVESGFARVTTRVGDTACARLLLAKEQTARAAKLGLWDEPYYVIDKADAPADVLKQRGRLALVEGKCCPCVKAAAPST